MSPPFRIREIAQQAGLSEATVDRVLHGRGGVRKSTVDEVQQAIQDLTRQRSQVKLGGRTFVIDLVIDSPPRFSAEVQAALEQELPGLRPATLRSRFHFTDSDPVERQVEILDAIGQRGSHGVVLKAADVPEINAAVQRLNRAKIPVITLVTDLPASVRLAYVGPDNRAAGATAAYLIHQWIKEGSGSVLVTRGDGSFRGEDEREMGFRSTLRTIAPGRRVVELLNPTADEDLRRQMITDLLDEHPDIKGVYSMYAFGADRVTIDAFTGAARPCEVFVAHDLDQDHLALLTEGRISALLHHDLREDMRQACQMIMQANNALPGRPVSAYSAVQVVTPFNVDPRVLV